MMQMRYSDRSYDLVVHSDTLEHVPQPVVGLAECYRVLGPGGFCVFTVPAILDRMTRSREGLPPSHHGDPSLPATDLVENRWSWTPRTIIHSLGHVQRTPTKAKADGNSGMSILHSSNPGKIICFQA